MALSAELRAKIARQAKDIDEVSTDITARVSATVKNQQSAAIASRLDNPINSPSVQAKQSAQIASRLDNSLINKAMQGTTNPAEMYRPGNVTESLFKTPNYISNNAMTEMVDRANARWALQQDNTATEKAREAAKKSAEQQKAAMERMVSDLYQKMEGYKNNGQTDELFKAEQEYAKLNDSIAQMNSKIHGSAMEEAKDWETQRYNEIMSTGGRVLLANLERLAELSDNRIKEADDERRNGLTETETEYYDLYNNLKAKYGEQVDSWLEYAKRMGNKSQMAMSTAKARQAAEDKPFWASVGSVPLNMASGAGYLDVIGQNLQRSITGSDAPIDYNSPAQTASKMTGAIRGTVSEDMGKFGSFLYNTGMSMANTLAAMPMGSFGMAMLGGSAATNAMQTAIERGASDGQALKIGLAAGAMETVMEKLSIDNLFKLKTPEAAKDVVLNILKQAGAEGTEEGLTTLANTIADHIIMGDKSELNAAKRAYMAEGYSADKAEGMALKDWGLGLLTDIAGGALSGGVFGGVKSGAGYRRYKAVENAMPKLQPETQAQPPVADIAPTVQPKSAKPNLNQKWEKFFSKNNGSPSAMAFQNFSGSLNDADSTAFIAYLDAQEKAGNLKWRGDGTPVMTMPADDHIDNRDYGSVGDPKVKSFQYNNPELQPFMQEGLQILADDLDHTLPGERYYNGIDPNGVGSQGLWSGKKRHTSPEIAMLKDDFGMSYEAINKAMDDLAQDAGRENNANAKRLELVIDQILTHGHRTLGGTEFPPNQAYIEAKGKIAGAKPIQQQTETEVEELPMMPGYGEVQDAKPAMGAADSGFDPISHASIEYGAIPPGEKASRVIDVPTSMDGKTRVSQYARTGAEARVTNDEMAQRIMDLVAENKLSHEVFTDEAALEAAGEKIAEAYQSGNGYNVYTQFLQDVAAGKAGKDLMATGSLLYADAAANGDYDSASELFVALTDLQTRAGQTVQAARLLKKLSPEGRVWVVNKIVGKIQNEVNQGRKPDNQIKIEVDDALIDAFKDAKTPKAQAEAMDNIYKAVAEQMPTTLSDAVNEFRYFMMLGNLSTHIKNIGGNLGMSTLVSIKNSLATTGEVIVDSASKAFGGKGIQRTKAFLNLASESDRALMGAAWADYENVQDDISGAGKYKDSARYQVSKYQSYWKLNDPKTKAGELVSKGLQMAEKAPQANSELMNMEDRWFSRPNYAVALAGYMKANNLTEPNDAARDYAVKEAQKATFRDLNAVSKWAKSLGKTKFTKFLVDSVFPFKATPANVGVRAVEYSPAGLAVTLGKAAVAVKKGEFNAAQFIDDLSANATGSLLAGLGYLLAQSGVLRVAGIGDDKEKQQQALEGHKNNSIYNVPIEFVSPAAATLLLGGAIYEAKATKELDGRSYGVSDSLNALSGITDPILETTMLDGLRGILSTVRSSDGKVDGKLLADIGIQIVGNYIGSFMSSQLSRVYAATDDATRTTYVDKTKDDTIANLPSVQKLVQGLQYKSPHRTGMVQDIDAWGRPIEGNKGSGGTDFGNFMESLFNVITPTYPGKVQETAVDKELKRLYRAGGVDNSKVSLFMKYASKDFTVDGKTVYLTGDQWEQYQTDRGQGAMTMRENLLNSDAYQSLSDGVKAVAMDIALEYANDLAKEKLAVGFKIDDGWMKDLAGADDETITDAIISRAIYREAGRIDEAENDEEKTRQDYFIDMLNDLDINRSEKRKHWIDAGYAESTCPW